MTLETARARVMELEAALDKAIAYLERLPRHPETTRVLQELAIAQQGAGASAQVSRRPLVGESFSRAGVPLLRAELHGQDLYVVAKTPPVSEASLLAALRAGDHLVHLNPLDPDAHATGLELRRAQGKPGKRP